MNMGFRSVTNDVDSDHILVAREFKTINWWLAVKVRKNPTILIVDYFI
jgi:hypothetical protein